MFAGPYLNTAAMLVHENAKAGHWIRMFLGDKELAINAAKMAKARSEVALKMKAPAEVQQAHPHLNVVRYGGSDAGCGRGEDG